MRTHRNSSRTVMSGLLLLGVLAVAASLAPAHDPLQNAFELEPDKPSILVQFIGHDSKRTQEGFVVIRNEKGWNSLWQEHTGLSVGHGAMERHRFPRVNFETCMAVAYFGGKRTNTDGFIAEDLAEIHSRQPDGPRRLRLRFTDSTFQTASGIVREIRPGDPIIPPDGFNDRGGAVDTTPFGIWILPATELPIVIERGKRHLKHEPLTWEEVRTVEPVEGT